jgi:uncharacterized protein YggE
MKKTLIAIAILSIFAGCTYTTAAQIEKERGYISVSTSADAEIAPDIAEISFSVKTSDSKSMQKATLMNKDISEKIYTMLKEVINTSNGDYIKTSNYNATPVYNYNGNKRTLDKYEVSNRVTVHTKSLDKLGSMIDKATEAGATNIDSLKFSVSNYENKCNSLIETATQKASTRASIAARGSNSSLDGIKSMDVSCSESYNNSNMRVFAAKNMMDTLAEGAAQSAVPTTSISGGVIKVFANVHAVYYVK